MIYKRKYLYRRADVDGVLEIDYLQTDIHNANLRVEKEITVTDFTEFRPDLISKIAYNSFNYGWLILDFNDILDPYEELTTGTVLEIPRLDDYFNFYNEFSRIPKDERGS